MTKPSIIQWGAASVWWAGVGGYTVDLPTTALAGQAIWLQENLRNLLGTELGLVDVSITPAIEATPPTSGFEQFGKIVIGALKEPLPDVDVLRRLLTKALAEADEAAEAAHTTMSAYQTKLHALQQAPDAE
jgi:hypothetical protein